MKQYAIFTSEYGVCAQTPVTSHIKKETEIKNIQ